MHTGTVFNIQRFSIHDGPGIRTTVFLKGCPLRCRWCHNPESNESIPQLAYYKNLCKMCGICITSCPINGIRIETGKIQMDRQRCLNCGNCAEVCPYHAREILGSQLEAEAVLEEIKKDQIFYQTSGGGMTISGGEPFYQPEFTAALLRMVREAKIHTAIETCGFASENTLREIAEYTDLFLYDIKHMDSHMHQQLTGVSNTLILKNLKILAKELKKDIWLRMPLIHDVNDSQEEMNQRLQLALELKEQIKRVCLLPYHTLGISKMEALDCSIELVKGYEPPKQERLDEIRKMWEYAGFETMISK